MKHLKKFNESNKPEIHNIKVKSWKSSYNKTLTEFYEIACIYFLVSQHHHFLQAFY